MQMIKDIVTVVLASIAGSLFAIGAGWIIYQLVVWVS